MNQMRKRIQHKKNGYTLVELLAEVTLVILIVLSVTTAFFTILRGSDTTSSRTRVKQESEAALNRIETSIRNARAVTCQTGTVQFTDQDGALFSFSLVSGKITKSTEPLTSSSITVTGFSLTCDNEAAQTGEIMEITFTACDVASSNTCMDFRSRVTARAR
jgi:Tfp pilus assembly protein PilX